MFYLPSRRKQPWRIANFNVGSNCYVCGWNSQATFTVHGSESRWALIGRLVSSIPLVVRAPLFGGKKKKKRWHRITGFAAAEQQWPIPDYRGYVESIQAINTSLRFGPSCESFSKHNYSKEKNLSILTESTFNFTRRIKNIVKRIVDKYPKWK